MPETKFHFEIAGIASLLASQKLAVPVYQRSFAWGDEGHRDHVEEFIADLKGTFGTEGAEYFLGTTVVSAEGSPGTRSVIDGQQRLATTAIYFQPFEMSSASAATLTALT